jgi:phosphoglycerate kinase
MANVLTLDNINVEGKTVLLRVDINSPLDPATKSFLDDTRIRAILPTLNRLSKAKTVLIAHQSRPGKNDFTSTLGHARELGRLLGRSIRWVDDIHGPKAMEAIEEMKMGDILMLNNIRMDPEEVNRKGDALALSETQLVQDLASVADVFVNDAFACAHRSSPSIVGFAHHLPCVAGELMAHEIRQIDQALESPARPCIAVLGGIKVDDSIEVAHNMLQNNIADEVWFTGGVANLAISEKETSHFCKMNYKTLGNRRLNQQLLCLDNIKTRLCYQLMLLQMWKKIESISRSKIYQSMPHFSTWVLHLFSPYLRALRALEPSF